MEGSHLVTEVSIPKTSAVGSKRAFMGRSGQQQGLIMLNIASILHPPALIGKKKPSSHATQIDKALFTMSRPQ